ncbi:MAG: hypothetical protein GY772_22065 [bacterium]|nr:hypothetical protein [bacterium]
MKQWGQWMVKQSKIRLPQYFAVWAVVYVVCHPSLQTAVEAVRMQLASQSLQVLNAMKVVAVLEAVRAGKALWQWGKSVARSLAAVEQTNQVVATRANMDEWRQCLQFASKWHNCRLQGAYRLWQLGQLSPPAPPANQWRELEQGQPMHVQDQCMAEVDVPEELQSLFDIDSKLTTVHEKHLMHVQSKRVYSEQELEDIAKYEAVYQSHKAKCQELGCWDLKSHSGEITGYIQSMQKEIDWSLPIFQ